MYRFPAYRKVLIDAGVAASDVNAVFDRWDADHKALDQQEKDMTRELQVLTQIRDDMTQEQVQEILTTAQQASAEFGTIIHQHLSSEEEYWVEQFITQNHITEKQAQALEQKFAQQHLKKLKPKELGYLLGFTMSPLGKQQEQAVLKSLLPLPVRCYYNWFARPSYMKAAPRLYLIAHGHVAA